MNTNDCFTKGSIYESFSQFYDLSTAQITLHAIGTGELKKLNDGLRESCKGLADTLRPVLQRTLDVNIDQPCVKKEAMPVHDAEFSKEPAFVPSLEADDPVVRGLDKKAI